MSGDCWVKCSPPGIWHIQQPYRYYLVKSLGFDVCMGHQKQKNVSSWHATRLGWKAGLGFRGPMLHRSVPESGQIKNYLTGSFCFLNHYFLLLPMMLKYLQQSDVTGILRWEQVEANCLPCSNTEPRKKKTHILWKRNIWMGYCFRFHGQGRTGLAHAWGQLR